jgi:capsid portal protein
MRQRSTVVYCGAKCGNNTHSSAYSKYNVRRVNTTIQQCSTKYSTRHMGFGVEIKVVEVDNNSKEWKRQATAI